MNLRGFQVKTAFVIFAIVLALGLGFQYVHQATQVLIPLSKELQELPGVEKVEISKGTLPNRSHTVVQLRLDKEVPLALSLGQVYRVLESSGSSCVIELEDTATVELLELFQKVQLLVEESIMTGEFNLLEARVQALTTSEGLEWELGVDRNFVYLRLQDSTHLLQRVIPRDQDGGRVAILTQGVGIWVN
ncbi:MAG: hypothetical protein GX956_05465 [Firmicutes bacterium]|nr:hypothetical protein [Bacillota bacterium]